MTISPSPTFETLKYADEATMVAECIASLPPAEDAFWEKVSVLAASLLEEAAAIKPEKSLHDLVGRFSLSSPEGLAMMGLAEALLRVPDGASADALIADKLNGITVDNILIGRGDVSARLTRGSMRLGQSMLGSFLAPLARPVARTSAKAAVKALGSVFVLANTIEAATRLAATHADAYSFDMLGEGARTFEDADTYFESYKAALNHIATTGRAGWGLSVKLSAIYPRYDAVQTDAAIAALTDRIHELSLIAAKANAHLTIDAEESERLAPSLEILKRVLDRDTFGGWDGLGLAVQAYQKRSRATLAWLESLNRPLQVRLVKGAYWDSEIRRAQLQGAQGYPVFTRKANTDVSYLACAKFLLGAKFLRPHFATHNAHTASTLMAWAEETNTKLRFQRLHGMGAGQAACLTTRGHSMTVYAPVGGYRDLLAYLVRRLLENGANTSFIGQIHDPEKRAAAARNPLQEAGAPHPHIPLPAGLFADRVNSAGLDLREPDTRRAVITQIAAMPIPDAPAVTPASALPDIVGRAAASPWRNKPVTERAAVLDRLADTLESERLPLLALLMKEAGRTLGDADAEVREAVDFCRYYAAEARKNLTPRALIGPTGERNTLYCDARGTFVCIAPWNFPLAIFLGQITAALVAGNSVIAKPAEQTPRIGAFATALCHRAGVPHDALQTVYGDGDLGRALVEQNAIHGVAFTGSMGAAKSIARTLAAKDGALAPLIAETGGLNAMIVDTTALPEQIVDDVVASAFHSAGQRCSSLRLLCLPRPTADAILTMLKGAMAALTVGNPCIDTTDIGPIIDAEAFARLKEHEAWLQTNATILHKVPDGDGLLFGPLLAELHSADDLTDEKFGPILHVIRYEPGTETALLERINAKGYGLTFGVQSRIAVRQQAWPQNATVGNAYVNRSIIGAVVGVQPFGGRGLSGTGPKAGGPHYLHAFVTEKLVSIDLTAAGGNAALINLLP